MKFILGQKKQMTQVFKKDGAVIPVTAISALPNVITQVKTSLPLNKGESSSAGVSRGTRGSDGYLAIQVGSGATKKSHKKLQLGHLKGLKPSRWLREFRFPITLERAERAIGSQSQKGDSIAPTKSSGLQNDKVVDIPEPLKKFKRGLEFGVEIFKAGDKVRVTGVSKGKGFQGVVKRHGFHGAPKSHGTKDQLRMPGSIGATGPAHVFKGKKMPGRMGGDKTTIKGLEVVKVDRDKNLLYIKGAVPGAFNSLVMISGPGTFQIQKSKVKNQNDLPAAQGFDRRVM